MKSLTIRLMIFNLLLIVFPLGSLLFLRTHEKQQLFLQEKAMVQQGRIFSSALRGNNLKTEAEYIINRLDRRQEARIRVVDKTGLLLADSAGVPIPKKEKSEETAISETTERTREITPVRDSVLYRAVTYVLKLFRKLLLPPPPPLEAGDYYNLKNVLDGPEIQSALEGRYGATTRYSTGGQQSINLYSAIPVFDEKQKVIGAVLVNQSTYKILNNIYRVRLDIIRVFFISIGGSILLSFLLAQTITIPVKKLRDQAERVIDSTGKLQGHIHALKRSDEIGDLSRSLNTLSIRLQQKIGFIDSFLSDILHEVKNPLAAIRASAEYSRDEVDETVKGLQTTILNETGRIERLLNELREITRIDSHLQEEKSIRFNLVKLLCGLEEIYKGRSDGIRIVWDIPSKPIHLKANPDRLIQALTNIIDNCIDFTPNEGKISLSCHVEKKNALITICDTGPGIPENNLETIFERFFSDRQNKGSHSGLGLAITKAIIEGYSGSVTAENREDKGSCFKIILPFKT